MANKISNVVARVEPNLKEAAENILTSIGIPVSTAINIFYREIVMWNGLPFRPSIPSNKPIARDEMTDDEFNKIMLASLNEAKNNKGITLDEAYKTLIKDSKKCNKN